MSANQNPTLMIDQLSVSYGHVKAVSQFSLSVQAGEVVALLGPNGAGKTTTLRALSGLLPIQQGRVTLNGVQISGRRPDQIARAGLLQVPEGRQVVAPLASGVVSAEQGLTNTSVSLDDIKIQERTVVTNYQQVKLNLEGSIDAEMVRGSSIM